MLGRDLVEPRIELTAGDLHDPMARGTDEVMVMLLAAPPIAELAGVVGERVHGAFARQDRQRSVHGGETRSLASVAETRVEGLRGQIVLLAHQLGEDERSR